MLTNFRQMLQDAYRDHVAIGSFNAYNYETIRGILEAGKQMGGGPVIVAFGKKYLSNMSLQDAAAIVRSLAAELDMPVCLHLDHCSDINIICQTIECWTIGGTISGVTSLVIILILSLFQNVLPGLM